MDKVDQVLSMLNQFPGNDLTMSNVFEGDRPFLLYCRLYIQCKNLMGFANPFNSNDINVLVDILKSDDRNDMAKFFVNDIYTFVSSGIFDYSKKEIERLQSIFKNISSLTGAEKMQVSSSIEKELASKYKSQSWKKTLNFASPISDIKSSYPELFDSNANGLWLRIEKAMNDNFIPFFYIGAKRVSMALELDKPASAEAVGKAIGKDINWYINMMRDWKIDGNVADMSKDKTKNTVMVLFSDLYEKLVEEVMPSKNTVNVDNVVAEIFKGL